MADENLFLSAEEAAQVRRDVEMRRVRREAEMRREASVPPADGAQLIARERARQIAEEGWTPEHDDGHGRGELSQAAACYALAGHVGAYGVSVRGHYGVRPDGGVNVPSIFPWWPWEVDAWKPTDDPIRNLVKAGALIAAEIDRLQRAGEEGGR